MKLKRGAIRTINELTGYSEKYINQVAKGECIFQTKARTKVEKAIEILDKALDKANEKVIKALAEIDLLYVRKVEDLDCIPGVFLKSKYGNFDRKAIFKMCEKRGYY